MPRAASTRETEASDGGAVGQQRRGVDRVVPGEDAGRRQRAEVLAACRRSRASAARPGSAWVGFGLEPLAVREHHRARAPR